MCRSIGAHEVQVCEVIQKPSQCMCRLFNVHRLKTDRLNQLVSGRLQTAHHLVEKRSVDVDTQVDESGRDQSREVNEGKSRVGMDVEADGVVHAETVRPHRRCCGLLVAGLGVRHDCAECHGDAAGSASGRSWVRAPLRDRVSPLGSGFAAENEHGTSLELKRPGPAGRSVSEVHLRTRTKSHHRNDRPETWFAVNVGGDPLSRLVLVDDRLIWRESSLGLD